MVLCNRSKSLKNIYSNLVVSSFIVRFRILGSIKTAECQRYRLVEKNLLDSRDEETTLITWE